MDTRPVVVVITSDDCGACKAFKSSDWPAVEKSLNELKEVRLKHINLKTMRDELPAGVPKVIQKYRRFYPTVLFIPGDAYNKDLLSPSTALFNLSYDVKTGVTPIDKMQQRPYSQITDWVKDQLKGKTAVHVQHPAAAHTNMITIPSMPSHCGTIYVGKGGADDF